MQRWIRRAQGARRWVTVLASVGLLRGAPAWARDGAETSHAPPPRDSVTHLTLAGALARARERAPAIVAERLRVGEARGRLVGASALLRENPVVEGAAGYRWAPAGQSTTEGRAAISQSFEIGGQRGARVAGARARVAQAEAGSGEVARRLLREVALAFVRALHARDRLELARSIEQVASEVLRVSELRHQSGDIARLDVTLAQTALARARSDVRAAEAERETSLAGVRLALGMAPDERFELEGSLREHHGFDRPELEARVASRPDVLALDAELRGARADRDLGAASRWPELGLGVSYEREERSDILLGTASLTLPLFERGQGLRAEAAARAERLTAELNAQRNAAAVELRAARAVYERRIAAVEELERGALPLLDESETQLRRSYEAGQLALTDFLAVRREIVGTRIEYVDRLLDAASAAVELGASAGALGATEP